MHPPPPPSPSDLEVIVMEADDQTSRPLEQAPWPPAAGASQNHLPPPSPTARPPEPAQRPPAAAAAAAATQNHFPPPPVVALHPERFSLFMNFCLTGLSISFQSNRTSSGSSNHLPISSQMAVLGTVLALAAFLVSKYIPENLGPLSRKLEIAGVFCGVTGFILDITPSVHLSLKIIFWNIYGFSLLAINLSRNFNIFRE
ncbi:hypothetical protein ACH5RR_025072 [Cinchona calisaya]|uniref:Uncharacterized protein n=1 Tax=Cinchona calisaya TaxID=153742 RepID=A0ABD2Z1Y2_9GENT